MATLFTSETPATALKPSYQKANYEMQPRRHATHAQTKDHHVGAEMTQQRFEYLNENLHSLSDAARIPLQISLTRQIQHLREEMNSLRLDSDTFKDKMECILVTLENLNEASFSKNSPWVSQATESAPVFEENPKNPISFKSPDRRKWVTGIASRISRDNTDPKANKTPLSPGEVRVKPAPELHQAVTEVPVILTNIPAEVMRPMPSEINLRNKKSDVEVIDAANKAHSKIIDARPTSDSFMTSHVKGQPNDTIEREISIQPKNANRLLSHGNDESFSNPSPKSATGEEQVRMVPVLDRTSKTLLTSEDSIDSGYHGGIQSYRTEQYEMAEFRLSSVEETHVIENKEVIGQKEIRPSSLSVIKNSNNTQTAKPEEGKGVPWEIKQAGEQAKPKAMPRNTKKIKMGVSAVMGPPPMNGGLDVPSQENGTGKQIHEEKQEKSAEKLEYFRRSHQSARAKQEMKKMQKMKMKTGQVNGSDSEIEGSSALRRRSMRMMSEFKMFDFTDSMKGINSQNKQSTPKKETEVIKKPEIVQVVEDQQSVQQTAANPPPQTGETSKKPPIRSNNSNGRSKKKSEMKFAKEPLPPPPLPPPPSPPHEKQCPIQKEAPFVGFTSLAHHSKEALVCHASTEVSLPSPRCVRRPVHGSTKSLQSTGAVSYGSVSPHNAKVTNITPSEGSAFTPVGFSNRCSHEILPCPNDVQSSRENVLAVDKENAPLPFKRRSSLPPSAISHRNQHKKSQEKKPPHPLIQAPQPHHPSRVNYDPSSESNFKRSVSMRLPKTRQLYVDQNNIENNPVMYNKEDNITSVVGKLKQAGYLSNEKKHRGRSSLGASTTQHQHSAAPGNAYPVVRHPDFQAVKKYEYVEQRSPRVERKMEADRVKHLVNSTQQPITSSEFKREVHRVERSVAKEQSSRLTTMGLIRSSFRSKKGKSTSSAANASHEFSMGVSRMQPNAETRLGAKQSVQEEVVDHKVARNKVKQRMDLKPATPTPAVSKARRKKQAGEKGSKSSMVGMLMDKLQISRSDNSSHGRQLKDDAHVHSKSSKQDRCDVSASSVPITRRFFKFPTREDNLKCGSLTSTSSISSVASHAPNSSLKKGRSTYV